MIFDLEAEQFTIDGNNSIFTDTIYQGEDFEIYAIQPTRTQSKILKRKARTKEGINSDMLLSKIWREHVVGWKIKGKGGKIIPFTDENKEAFLEKRQSFTNLVATACMDQQTQLAQHEEELKNSEPSGDGEQ